MPEHANVARARRRLAAAGLALSVAVAAAGCGISSTNAPTDVGDALVSDTSLGSDVVRAAPDPNSVSTVEDLVRTYFKAAVGGGKAAINPVKAFFTENYKRTWLEPSNPNQLTIVRLIDSPVRETSVDRRTSVRVRYRIVGVLTDQGRVDELVDPVTRTMRFWVQPAEETSSRLRIDEIQGEPAPRGGLLLSDEALIDLYRPQPVYFWDSEPSRLVPDLRYLPLTLNTEQRAFKILQWLIDGPSGWLTGAQRLPSGTAPKAQFVILHNGAFVVNLTAQAGASGQDDINRLYYQLRWSLRTPAGAPEVELQIEGKVQDIPGTADEYLQYNLTNELGSAGQKFDIVDQRVVPLPAGATPPAVLTAKENLNVLYAALNRARTLAAFVRVASDGRRFLQFARERKAGKVDAKINSSFSMGRPAWVPGTNDHFVVTSGGRMYAVAAADGRSAEITPNQVGNVTRVAVAPDGRRVAFVASGQVFVASLKWDGERVTVGSNPRRLLAGHLSASTVAWQSESWLYVAGTAGNAPAMWRVTADSVVAENLSKELRGVTPTDLIAYPAAPATTSRLAGELIVLTGQPGAYHFTGLLGTLEKDLHAPFFAG